MRIHSHQPLLGYVVAILCTAVAALLTVGFPGTFQAAPFFLFMIVVLISAWYGGLGPGLVATGLGGMVVAYLLPPAWSLRLDEPRSGLRLAFFLVIAGLS